MLFTCLVVQKVFDWSLKCILGERNCWQILPSGGIKVASHSITSTPRGEEFLN